MRRVILTIAAVLLTSIGWSQTVTLKFKNGTTQQYNMSELESIDFTDGDSGNNQDTTPSIVGTWLGVSGEGWGLDDDADGELPIFHIKKDGTYINIRREDEGIVVEHGLWTIENGKFVRYTTDGDFYGTTLEYTIVTLTADTLVLRIYGFTLTFKRVSSSVLNKYADLI